MALEELVLPKMLRDEVPDECRTRRVDVVEQREGWFVPQVCIVQNELFRCLERNMSGKLPPDRATKKKSTWTLSTLTEYPFAYREIVSFTSPKSMTGPS